MLKLLLCVSLCMIACGTDRARPTPTIDTVAHYVDGDPCNPATGEPPANGRCPAYDAVQAYAEAVYRSGFVIDWMCIEISGSNRDVISCSLVIAYAADQIEVQCGSNGDCCTQPNCPPIEV